MTKAKSKLEEYCDLIQKLKTILGDTGYLVLKLYQGYDRLGYEPRDVDIFLGKNLRKTVLVLRNIGKAFPKSKAVGRGKVLVNGHSLEVDIYFEIIFSPISVLDEVTENTRTVPVPWCEEIKVRSLDPIFNALYILFHALRHKRLYGYETLSFIEEARKFDISHLKSFVLHAKKTGLECLVYSLLKIVLYHSKYVLKEHNVPTGHIRSFYHNILKLVKILAKTCPSNRFSWFLVDLSLRKTKNVPPYHTGLWCVFPLYVLRSLVLAFRSPSKNSMRVLLTIIFIYFLYEYVTALFRKLKLLT